MYADPPDDGCVPRWTHHVNKNPGRGGVVRTLIGRPITSTHQRAKYWREYKRKKKYDAR